MISLIRRACAILIVTAGTAIGDEQNERVSFATAFSDGNVSGSNSIVIQIASDQVLVFDASVPFNLNGKNLLVFAEKIRVEQSVEINSFSKSQTAPSTPGVPDTPADQSTVEATGTKGSMGDKGKPGAGSGKMIFDIAEIVFSDGHTLALNANGQTGGKGQQGGQGGRGGPGKNGRNATEFPKCGGTGCPGEGGKGGKGGTAGAGGQGGPGGPGGEVLLSQYLYGIWDNGNSVSLLISAPGGLGGSQGEKGRVGIGGPGGARGKGSKTCICEKPPPPGPDGDRGDANTDQPVPSDDGPKGSIRTL